MSSNVKVAVAQINCSVGDFEGNSRKIVEAAARAVAEGAHVMVTPELSLTGYPPEDLLLRRAFYAACDSALQRLAVQLVQYPDLAVVVGHPLAREGLRFNAASVLQGGVVVGTYCKHDLPNYDVFDEQRYFTPDNRPFVFEAGGTLFGVNICEDTWFHYAPECAQAAGAQVLLVLNASPFHLGKQAQRLQTMRSNVSHFGLPLVYANLTGGQDELVFDGASFVLAADGTVVAMAPYFDEAVLVVEFIDGVPQPASIAIEPSLEALAYQALVLGVRDYVGKNGFPGALIGLSGGVDSALTLAIAVDALGADRVRAVMMPSQFTAPMSLDDAATLARNLGVRHDVLPIKPPFDAFLSTLADEFRGLPWDTTEENLQARIRGTLLMALSNKYGAIVLTTGNKSETAVGYSTLYGDLAGGFAVIKDILKTLVYRLCRYRNSIANVIPERILTRAPSAELKAGQTDQDSLPEYEVLDAIITRYMQEGESIADIVDAGFDEGVVRQVVRMIRSSEYKRRQSPVGIRVTHRSFGRDWRYPITNRFREENATL
ncbi:MAG TPA: NAD+ synthase [Burkholderiaceae bacterium]|nr:NAD+ synthase [Burkholderiaceae bacterium]HQR75298.1 NAD+ synthase [Burkholderiaceae bacterium]